MRKFLFAVVAAVALCLSGAGIAYAGEAGGTTSHASSGGSCTTGSCGDTVVECPQGTSLVKLDARRLLRLRVGDGGSYSCYGTVYRRGGGSACDSSCTSKTETVTYTVPRRVDRTSPASDCVKPLISAIVWLRGLHL